MTQKELKPGDTKTYEIEGHTLKLTPMPWGRLKKIFKVISESFSQVNDEMISNQAKFIMWLADTIEVRMNDIFPLIIDQKLNPFFTQEWVDETLTIIQIQEIVQDAIVINGVTDFLDKMGKKNLPPMAPAKEPAGATN